MNFVNLGSTTATAVTILDWVARNKEVLIAIPTIVIAMSTLITVILTWMLARENRLLRKAGTEPEVVAYLTIHPLYQTFLNFVLANVGRGPARNVRFEFDVGEKVLDANEIRLKNSITRKPISFLPQGESISVYFGDGRRAVSEPMLPPFDVLLKYEDLKGKQHRKTCRLDVAQFDGFGRLGNPPEQDMAKALGNIEKHLEEALRIWKNH